VPSYLDLGSFFRKARRDVYYRDEPIAQAQASDDSSSSNQEWAVFLEAWYAFGTTSRLAQRVFNLFTLLLCFGLFAAGGLASAASVDPSGLQKLLLALSLLFYGLFNCFKALKVVSLLGKVLKITDADLLPFTRGLKERNDAKCASFDEQAIKFCEAETARKSTGNVEMRILAAMADNPLRDSIPSRHSASSSSGSRDTNAAWEHVNPMVSSALPPTRPAAPAAPLQHDAHDQRLSGSGNSRQLLQSIYDSSGQHSPLQPNRSSGAHATLGNSQRL